MLNNAPPSDPRLDHASNLLAQFRDELDAMRKTYAQNAILFPRPGDGAVVEISPPPLAWLPLEGTVNYRVEIEDTTGVKAYERIVGHDPVHLPDRVLAPGAYSWDVVSLDQKGRERTRRGRQSFSIAVDVPELPWVPPEILLSRVPRDHPRFLYVNNGLPSIRATLETTRRRSWRACIDAAERGLKARVPSYPAYHLIEDRRRSRLQGREYQEVVLPVVDRALMDLSLAYLMTKEARYGNAARRILLELADWPTDDNDVTSVSAKWGDEPGLSLARCLHRAYDWLYETLSRHERAKVLAACEGRAWQTYRRLLRYNYLTYPGESHNGRLIAYLAEMAIVMARESQGATTWLDYSLKALTTIYPHWGGDDGGWAEGARYGMSYCTIYTPALECLRTTTGFDLWRRPFSRKVRYFFFYCTALRGEISPFGDGAEKGGPGTTEGNAYASLLWCHAHRFRDRHIGWWVNQIQSRNSSRRELSLLFEDSLAARPPVELPSSRAFHSVGWAALHSNVSTPDQDTFLLFKSSPYGSVSHSHADQNNFCIMKGGKALAIPSGYYGPLVGMPHHSEWTCATKANNCVLVNGAGQTTRDRRAKGGITAFKDTRGLSYVAGNAAAAYMGKMRRCDRHILFVRPCLFLLLDDIEAPEPAIFQWMLHALEKMEVDIPSGHAISRRKGATLQVWLRSTAGRILSQTDRFDTAYNAGVPDEFHREMPDHWHLTAETTQKAGAVRIGAVMVVAGPHEHFDLDVMEKDGWFGATLNGTFGKIEGFLQLRPGTVGPERFDKAIGDGNTLLCGRSADGELFVQGFDC